MNKLLLFFVLTGTTLMTAYAQAPKGINYQGVARDSEGKPIISKNISVRISILKSAANGEVEYSETHKPQTNQFGLFTLVIGQGTAGTGSFAFVSWAVGNKWLQIEIDPEGGSSFQLAGSQQLMSVPYAFYSEYSGNSSSLMAGQGISINNNVISNTGDGDTSSTNELITGASLTADKKLRITDAGGTKEVDLNTIANTDNQSLTLAGTTLAISGGNTVDLSSALSGSNQNLTLGTIAGTNRTINITNGTGVTLDVADNDNNSTNEIQTLTKTGAVVSLSNGGGAITLNDDNATNEIQALTKTGATISLSNGGGSITLNDDNATNEIQDLTLNTGTNILSLTNDATTVDLTPYKQSLTYTPATNSLAISGGNNVNITSTLTQVLTTNPNAGAIRIQNVGAPSATTDATTKGYVDTAIATAIATNYAFKTSYSFINTGGSFADSPISLTEDFDDFNVVGTNRFTAPSAGVYSFNVTGNSTMGGIPIRLKVTSGTTTYFDIKRQQSYPLASTVNYHDSIIFKLNAGDTVELVVTSTGLGERVDGFLFGHKL
ncbi:MAG TPA: hypothetical protein PKJ83_14690 [Cyclobacteriaceae bacterium]|nr:hypothetical protein [Cyclobacteriaceae bacterium]